MPGFSGKNKASQAYCGLGWRLLGRGIGSFKPAAGLQLQAIGSDARF